MAPSTYYRVRWMIPQDLEEVLAIEGQGLDPWTEEKFLASLRERNIIGMVAENGEEVVGFMIYELHKGHLFIQKIAAKDGCSSVYRELLAKVVTKLESRRRTRAKLDVDDRHLNMHLLLKGNGWEAVRVVSSTVKGGHDNYRFIYSVAAST